MRLSALIAILILISNNTIAGNIYRYKLPKDVYDSSLSKSCASLLEEYPSSTSSYVTIFPNGLSGPPIEVFCDMSTDGGGWTRILSVGVGNSRCFGEFSLNEEGYCVKSGKTVSFLVDTMGISYSEIRGGVSAYQSGSNDGFRRYEGGSAIGDTYVDGISFTYNDNLGQRNHLFTYAIGQSQSGNEQSCPDVGGVSPPSFVGSNYYCESGNMDDGYSFDFYEEELFGGYQFSTLVSSSEAVELEVRVMNDQSNEDENIALNGIYIYIR
jgi:hypothetical protein